MQHRESKRSAPRRPMLLQMILAASLVVMALVLFPLLGKMRTGGHDLIQLTNRGKFHYDRGETAQAIELFQQALKLSPANPDALMNLANAYLLANDPANAIQLAQEVLAQNPNAAAAHYVIGCADLRERQDEAAVKSLQQAQDIDPTVGAVTFQLALAQQELGQFDAAIALLEEVVRVEPEHPLAHYLLSQLFNRTGRNDAAKRQLEIHQQLQSKRTGAPVNLVMFERCKYTNIRIPAKLEQPSGLQ